MQKTKYLEIIVGFIIILVSLSFLIYLIIFHSSVFKKNYNIKAIFYDIGGLNEGSKVRINGYIIGRVSKISLNMQDFNVEVDLLIDKNILIPNDSSIELVSAGVFEGFDLNVLVGDNKEYLTNGAIVTKTKDYVSLEDKIGSIFLNMGK
jgi:phospholipid/cholesterol/gamma-HCH transport system substrate-binding protein